MIEVNKKNFKKILRELDLAKYPSLDDFLVKVRAKLIKKEPLSLSEDLMGFAKLKNYLADYEKMMNEYYVANLSFSKFSHRPPKPFQEDGIKFLLKNNRCILADDMGLGKSIQSILAALLLPEDYKILIVTNRTLKYNFETEISYYSNSCKVIEKKWESGYKFTVINYEAVKKFTKDILKEKFNCIIADEATALKNSKAARTKYFTGIIKDVEKLWLLTGTPMTNRPMDYYNLLKLIKHPITKNWVYFVETYCDGKQEYGVWNTSGASNLKDLHEKTKSSVLRRLKKDYLPELPDKNRTPVFLHLDNLKGYNKVIDDYASKKAESFTEEFGIYSEDIEITEMTKLILWRQFCALEKINDGSLIDLINQNIDEGHKVVVFTNFTKVVDAITNHFGTDLSVGVDGRIKDAKDRLKLVDDFNKSDTKKVLVFNQMVGSMGFNVQSATVAIINDLNWVPGMMVQMEDRLWRMGQLKEVNILYLLYKNTVERIMFDVINSKMKNISTAIEGNEEEYFASLETSNKTEEKSILQEIFAQLKSIS